MRPSCLTCARKHLGQACVLSMEALKGYPVHAWYAVGHMAEAEDELLVKHEELATEIRKHRLEYIRWLEEGGEHIYVFPYEQLIEALNKAAEVEDPIVAIDD